MAETRIEWAHYTFNPWWGCTQVSPACDSCYAMTFSHRLGFSVWGKDSERKFFGDNHWHEPFNWNRKAQREDKRFRVFCGSMCDVMEERIDLDVWRSKLYYLIENTPYLDWLLLSKRPQNFRRFLPETWIEKPRRNVWLMTTVESSKYLNRIDTLKSCPAVVQGLSIEPLLEPLPTLGEYLGGIDWVIVGGESGIKARPMHPEWVRSIRDQYLTAGAAFHFKQWGEHEHFCMTNSTEPTGESTKFFVFPDGTAMRRVGKKAAGRLLDGVEWNEYPQIG